MEVQPSRHNGLKWPSIIRLNKLTTLDKDLVLGKLGSLTEIEIGEINNKLIKLLKLNNP
jgi:mRNA interferase MazF